MRAVVGTVNSLKPISLSKAAPVLSRFASSVASAGTRREVAAYLNRASAAFDELVNFHRDLKDDLRRNSSNGVLDGGKEKRKMSGKSEGGKADPKEAEVDGKENIELAEERSKKKRKSKKNREEVERENGGLDVDRDGDGKRKNKSDSKKKKKKRDREEEEGEGSEIHDGKKKRRKN